MINKLIVNFLLLLLLSKLIYSSYRFGSISINSNTTLPTNYTTWSISKTSYVDDVPFEYIPFNFQFYNKEYDGVYISANGIIHMSSIPPCCDTIQCYFITNTCNFTNSYDNSILIYPADLNPLANGKIYYKKDVDKLYILYHQINFFDLSSIYNVTFMLELSTTSIINFYYYQLHTPGPKENITSSALNNPIGLRDYNDFNVSTSLTLNVTQSYLQYTFLPITEQYCISPIYNHPEINQVYIQFESYNKQIEELPLNISCVFDDDDLQGYPATIINNPNSNTLTLTCIKPVNSTIITLFYQKNISFFTYQFKNDDSLDQSTTTLSAYELFCQTCSLWQMDYNLIRGVIDPPEQYYSDLCYKDCNNDWNGTAFYDDCNICSAGNTHNITNKDYDCHQLCFGPFELNDQNQCLCENNTKCDNIPYNQLINDLTNIQYIAVSSLNQSLNQEAFINLNQTLMDNPTQQEILLNFDFYVYANPYRKLLIKMINETMLNIYFYVHKEDSIFYQISLSSPTSVELEAEEEHYPYSFINSNEYFLLNASDFTIILSNTSVIDIHYHDIKPNTNVTHQIVSSRIYEPNFIYNKTNISLNNTTHIIPFASSICITPQADYIPLNNTEKMLYILFNNPAIITAIQAMELFCNFDGILSSIQFNNNVASCIIPYYPVHKAVLVDLIYKDNSEDQYTTITLHSKTFFSYVDFELANLNATYCQQCDLYYQRIDSSLCYQDCNNQYYGTAYYDDCNICSNGNTNHLANIDQDCAGICFGNFSIITIDNQSICTCINCEYNQQQFIYNANDGIYQTIRKSLASDYHPALPVDSYPAYELDINHTYIIYNLQQHLIIDNFSFSKIYINDNSIHFIKNQIYYNFNITFSQVKILSDHEDFLQIYFIHNSNLKKCTNYFILSKVINSILYIN